MSDTHFNGVDSKTGFKVNGTTVINENGDVTGDAPRLVSYQETVALAGFTDGGGAAGTVALSTSIPEGAVYARSFIDAVTGFAGDTSATIQIGDGSDVDRYSTGTPTVFTTADHISAGAASGTIYHSAAKTPTVTITSGADWGSVTAGSVTITLMYYQSI